ncbi:MarR family transcriptional regulator [Streptomyces longwoodensis]|uniref:MarR family transcriptional regulator n=1 Tax=Streptomyces lasalocidi TaxID=324833 RepID=A0A4V6XZB4_STRLS|nr:MULTISPECIES: MarR family transcriptional regulator [Streptomyces]TKS99202.1 MarR family transcriptional regulator [Streptomyces lasalocidi]WUC61481.1 MarR family transcriptional regulator [Streptomyces longwoodensis]
MSPSSPEPDQVARVTSEAAELLGVLWGRASTAPVSASQLRVLFVLEHHEGINLRTLAETLGSSPSSTSRLCDRLQAVGFVERRSAAGSRRELELYLSHRGRSFLAVLRERRESALESVLAQMPAARRAALLHGLEAFCLAAAGRLHEGHAASDTRTA